MSKEQLVVKQTVKQELNNIPSTSDEKSGTIFKREIWFELIRAEKNKNMIFCRKK